MAHKGLKTLTSDETACLQYEQSGADIFKTTNSLVNGFDYIRILPGIGTSAANISYAGMSGDDNYWIGIQNIGSVDNLGAIEEAEIQAQSLFGDDLAKNGTMNDVILNDINLSYGDIVYGVFNEVRLRCTLGSGHLNVIRLIRGV